MITFNMPRLALLALLALSAVLAGCATQPRAATDYAAFLQAKPASLLVLPPLNDSTDIKATPGVWAQATRPLAEAGYYVMPITLVDETFKQNGLTGASDIHEVSTQKLHEFFGADAAVYLRVKQYGTSYAVISSDTVVSVEARIVDLRTGQQLWEGTARASSAEQQRQGQGGVVGLLVTALVKQIIGTATDAGFNYAGIANQRLLSAPMAHGVVYGPRSPNAGQVPAIER